jgi:hypothetical protein
MPLKANFEESRMGTLYYPEDGNLKVDIGNNVDLASFYFDSQQISLGIEFMAYGLSTNYGGNRLQIDAIDGFFGGNVTYSYKMESSRIKSRFRFVHNSSHLVDGSYLADQGSWKEGREPIPFTRDFFELTAAHEISSSFAIFQYYGSGSYAVLVRPSEIGRIFFNAGFESAFTDPFGKIFGKGNSFFAAYQFTLRNYGEYTGSSHLMGGIKFGDWLDKGIVLYVSYYSGNHIFNEYYYERISRLGFGFMIDFI